MSCSFCFNAHVWAAEEAKKQLSLEDIDPFDEGLHDENDGSSSSIGHCTLNYRILFNSGRGQACNVEISRWNTKTGWIPIAQYFPKFCPECGRPLTEYEVAERGTNFKRIKKEC